MMLPSSAQMGVFSKMVFLYGILNEVWNIYKKKLKFVLRNGNENLFEREMSFTFNASWVHRHLHLLDEKEIISNVFVNANRKQLSITVMTAKRLKLSIRNVLSEWKLGSYQS